ncbi:MAG: GIY-YIG nuclease family protein [Elusimicrobiota bacterium]
MKEKLERLPQNPGVYIFKDSEGSVIYVGKAVNLKNRISSYFSAAAEKTWKTSSIKISAKKIEYIPCLSEREALILERRLIKKFNPFFNKLWKDGKEYQMIKITREDFPRLEFTRRKEKDKAYYFGPFPKSEIVKKMVYRLEKEGIIKLRKCSWNFSLSEPLPKNKMLSCLYYHTGQCPAPCDKNKIDIKKYRVLVLRTKKALKGNYSQILKELRKEMNLYSQKKEYEKAAEARDCINAIRHMSENVRIEEINVKSLENSDVFISMKEKLFLKKVPLHIEVFDISQLFSRQAAASCVCFIKGEKNRSHYRKFKIRFSPKNFGGDDFEMIKEAVSRRLNQIKRQGEPAPDLLLIDGGKIQLKKAAQALRESQIETDIISLAKRMEEVYIIGKEDPIRLNQDSGEILLLRKMRDEAHRFAVSYHRKLRNKNFL